MTDQEVPMKFDDSDDDIDTGSIESLEQVTDWLSKGGLVAPNLIFAVDFTNITQSEGVESLSPCESVISLLGTVLAPLTEHKSIPYFTLGFSRAMAGVPQLFNIQNFNAPCYGHNQLIKAVKERVRRLQCSGTSYGSIIGAALDIVDKNESKYHILVIITNSQVVGSSNVLDQQLTEQERETIESIKTARSYPISIIFVGGNGPREDIKIPDDKCDNIQFVNFNDIVSQDDSSRQNEVNFALAALKDIPSHYKKKIGQLIFGAPPGQARVPVPLPSLRCGPADNSKEICGICWVKEMDTALGCGHRLCRDCGAQITRCPLCMSTVTIRLRIF